MIKKLFIFIFVIASVFLFLKYPKRENKTTEPDSFTPSPKETVTGCGNRLCENSETKISCPNDCDENTCRDTYSVTENICLEKGWQKIKIDVNGIERELLWKGPPTWTNGAIIAMHGGEGVDSNFCASVPWTYQPYLSDIIRGVPMEEFSNLALSQGFAVFSLNSTYNRVTDSKRKPIGKRWDSLLQEGKANIDLPFIEKVIDEIIPRKATAASSNKIFLTGISSGGFMATLAATHFPQKVAGFSPVSAGDPYGTHFDMSYESTPKRQCAPGTWRDNETNKSVNQWGSCYSENFLNELPWPSTQTTTPFKQFHNKGDAACDLSCAYKVRKILVERGYKSDGIFVLDPGERTLEAHFWQREYNQPILDFFKKQVSK